MQSEIQGEGIIDWILERRPKPLNNFLKNHGDKRITYLSVCRVPLSNNIKKVANWVTFGKYKERMESLNYKDMFHLYLLFRFEGDEQIYTIEKNERVGIKKGFNKDGECRQINFTKSITLNTMITNAEKNGLKYKNSVEKYNCQNFLVKLLSSSGLLTLPFSKT